VLCEYVLPFLGSDNQIDAVKKAEAEMEAAFGTYCVDAHTTAAKMLGATGAEIQEAVQETALIRHWSIVLTSVVGRDRRFLGRPDEYGYDLDSHPGRSMAWAGKG
jgi:hypothetical protein